MSTISVGDLLFRIPVSNVLGEGVQWHIESQSIWWTDIQTATLFNFSIADKKLKTFAMPDRVGCFGFSNSEHELIVAFAKGIARYNLQTQEMTWISQPERDIRGNRFNDGRVDRQGRFWAGTMVEEKYTSEQSGALYMLNSAQNIQPMIEEINISNSLCWSPDGLTMYHCDSPLRTIYQYNFDPQTSKISHKKVFAKTPDNSFPDGATVDHLGGVWSAHWGGGKIVRYTAQGDKSLELALPVSQPTCVAIGGKHLDWLIITTAKESLSDATITKEPYAGDVFVYQLHGVKGIAEPQCVI
ncbi:SMP-30/gluconolactonase/LRE family protein [Thalassotalea sp. G2M2-11]|uniref:SMP-30/gluconolactonase/LRE family protein n=1 Tax=Thalassotalea sp. G2M2-11 TaxID=2787627 RepID=UPI0019CF7CC9|nr:SMP-30/gluconolactonase/LRE family protein [Thalassotalea sp. G2M2-11]